MSRSKILVIDDEDQLRKVLSRIIELEGYEVFQAEDAVKGLKVLDHESEILVVISDVRLPDINGLILLEKIKKIYPLCEVILLTAYGSIHDGVEAIKQGAFDYITKGDGDDQIIVTVEKAVSKAILRRRIDSLEKKLKARYSFDRIIGKSQVLKDAIALASRVAPADSTVLLEGKTGTGKELFAQSIHHASPRRDKPFVAVNCSAFPKDLLESEIFGHKKGSFTGANADKKGLFEEANEGTLFLDEIAEMHPELQSKLLRVLEDQTFIRVGDTKTTKVNVRIIAATNRDLLQESQSERFRSDLYYRLSGFKIRIPSLCERKEDIPDLVNYFISFYSSKTNKRISGTDELFMARMRSYNWPGNTRELKNVIERAVLLSDMTILTTDLLPYEIISSDTVTGQERSDTSLEAVEKEHILKILKIAGGNKTKAAEMLGLALTTLYRKIAYYKI